MALTGKQFDILEALATTKASLTQRELDKQGIVLVQSTR